VSIVVEAMGYHHGGMSDVLRGKPTRAPVAMGGAETAAMVGGMLECSSQDHLPVLLDEFIIMTATMIACMMDTSVSRLLLFTP
jgi:NaMN:DMB phosphoribosyltransferase